MVCPCEAIAEMSSRAIPASAITSIAASASHSPRSKLSRQYSAGVPPPRAALSRERCAGVYERDVYANRSTSIRPSVESLKRATAALIPSSEVPDIKPTTTPGDTSALADGRRLVPGDAPNHPAILGKKSLGVFAGHAPLLHDDRRLDALVSLVEKFSCLVARDPASLHHDPLASIDELVVRGAEIDHEVAVRFSEPDHRASGDGVENELGRGSGLHAGGARYRFRPYDRQYGHVNSGDQVRRRRGGSDNAGSCADLGGALESRANVRRRSGSGDSDHEILLADTVLIHGASAVSDDVFGALLRACEGG